MSNEFSIKVNIDTDCSTSKEDFEKLLQKDMEKAIKAVCVKYAIDLYQITVDQVL